MRRILPVVSLIACALSPAIARAQSLAVGAPGGAKIEGPGLKLGDRVVFHAGIGAELRFDSNVFYEDKNETMGLALRLTPNFSIASHGGARIVNPDGTASVQKVTFRIGAGLDYREWLWSNTGIRPPRQFNILANGNLVLLPTGPVSIEIFDNFVRSSQPPYTAVPYNLDRDVNDVGLKLRIKPGGGRLELQLTYAFGIDLWEVKQLQLYDNFNHHSTIRLLWKFLPKTSVYIQGDNYVYQYRHTAPLNPDGSSTRPNGYPLRVIAGLNGLLTAELTFDLYAGYANGFYESGPSPNTGIAGLTLTWRAYALGTATLGYRHDFLNTLLGVYADIDSVQASWTQQIWRFSGYLRLAYQNSRYKGIAVPAGATATPDVTERTDNGFTLNARIDFFTYRNWLATSLGYDFNLVSANHNASSLAGVGVVPVDFKKHELYLSLALLY